MSGMSQAGCCCGSGHRCIDCEYVVPICCLTLENTAWTRGRQAFRTSDPQDIFSGSTCEYARAPYSCTNTCGLCITPWCGDTTESGLPCRPPYDTSSHQCLPTYMVIWGLNNDCENRVMRVERHTYNHLAVDVPITEDWYLGQVEILDNVYEYLNSVYPTEWPAPIPSFRVSVCPSTYTEFPEPDERVYFKAQYEEFSGGVWVADTRPEILKMGSMYSMGNFVCGASGCSSRVSCSWRYLPYTDEIAFTLPGGQRVGEKQEGPGFARTGVYASGYGVEYLPYNDGAWANGVYYRQMGTIQGKLRRIKAWRVVECEDPDPVPDPFCRTPVICVLLSVDEGESYKYYSLVWDAGSSRYEMGASLVPGDKPYTIELILTEDLTTPANTIRDWILEITIREEVSGDIVLEQTEEYDLDCTKKWEDGPRDIIVPLTPPEEWLMTLASNCEDVPPPDPPACDPLCWPECVLCPDPLSMSIVVSENTVCCFNGTFALTHDSGANRYYLPAPVGYTAGVCGGIRTFVMTCDSETSVTFTWKYRDEDGNDNDRTDVVSAACSGGSFETAAVEILSILFSPGICNRGGIGKGANVRVVGV